MHNWSGLHQLTILLKNLPGSFLCFYGLSPADPAALITAPLTGEAVWTGMFPAAADARRHIDHPDVVWQLLKSHNSPDNLFFDTYFP